MGTKLGTDAFLTSREDVKKPVARRGTTATTPPTSGTEEHTPEGSVPAATKKDSAPKKSGSTLVRKNWAFERDLIIQLRKGKRDWVGADLTNVRYDVGLTETGFVACLLGYALDALAQSIVDDDGEDGMAEQLLKYAPQHLKKDIQDAIELSD